MKPLFVLVAISKQEVEDDLSRTINLLVVMKEEPQEDFPDDASLHIEKEVGRKTSVSVEMAEKLDMAVKENNEDEINTGLLDTDSILFYLFFTTIMGLWWSLNNGR